jgi:hypothetical protein
MEGIVELLLEVKIVEYWLGRLRICCPGQAKSCLSERTGSGDAQRVAAEFFPLRITFPLRKLGHVKKITSVSFWFFRKRAWGCSLPGWEIRANLSGSFSLYLP